MAEAGRLVLVLFLVLVLVLCDWGTGGLLDWGFCGSVTVVL